MPGKLDDFSYFVGLKFLLAQKVLTEALRHYTGTGSTVVTGLVFCLVKEIRTQAAVVKRHTRDH